MESLMRWYLVPINGPASDEGVLSCRFLSVSHIYACTLVEHVFAPDASGVAAQRHPCLSSTSREPPPLSV